MDADARVEFALPAVADNVPLVRHALAGLAEAIGMEASGVADLKTVVTEACMNVVVHAYPSSVEPGLLEVTAWEDAGCLAVTVRDFGDGIRPLAEVEQRSLRLGLPLIAALTTSFELGGDPGRGTWVTMRVPLVSPNGNGTQAARPASIDETRINVPVASLQPVLSRVIAMFAARADLSVDELSDAVLISDALSAQGSKGFPGGTARIAVKEEAGAFNVHVGPLEEGGGRRLLEGLRIPTLDATLETLADDVRIEPADGGELLMMRIGGSD